MNVESDVLPAAVPGVAATAAPTWPPDKVPPAFKGFNWDRATLPAGVCGAKSSFRLTNGDATIKSARWPGLPHVYVNIGVVRYGDIAGSAPDQAALNVWCTSGSGTADGQMADSWVIFTAAASGVKAPREIGILTPQQPVTQGAGHVPYFNEGPGGIVMAPGQVIVHELWYGPVDATCCPSGQATTVWAYTKGAFQLSTVKMTKQYTPLPKALSFPVSPLTTGVAAIGTLDAINPATGTADFSISCGWGTTSDKPIAAGFAEVNLKRDTFGLETNLANPAAGSVAGISFAQWASFVRENGWKGYLYLNQHPGWLTNGPGSDVCHGKF